MQQYTYQRHTPIVALASAHAHNAALAVIRCSGEETFKLLKPLFSQAHCLHNDFSHRAQLGWLKDGQQKIDQILVIPFANGHSYTGEESAELHCHGGRILIDRILQLLYAKGFYAALPGEFSYRAFINGRLTLNQAESVAALTSALHSQQQQQASAQLAAQPSQQLQKIYNNLLQLLAHIEVQLDYSEEEIDLEPLNWAHLDEALTQLEAQFRRYKVYQRYQHGFKVVLVGKTNAGKSSLFNLMLQQKRALVSAEAGTTRDYLDAQLEFAGWQISLYDTAGLRHTENQLEQQGIEKSWELFKEADLLILVADSCSTEHQEIATLLEKKAKGRWFGLWNKIDLPETQAIPSGYLGISCQSEIGLPDFYEKLEKFLPQLPDPQEPFPLNERQSRLIQESIKELKEARKQRQSQSSFDLLAEPLRYACSRLGELLGFETNQQDLEKIFSSFCLGK